MGRFEWDWFIGWTCSTVTVLSIVSMIYFGVQSTNEKYYTSMEKCIAAGGSFIPQSQGSAICMMGVK